MYTHIIHEMVGTRVAESLYGPKWMDRDGQIVDEQESLGCKVLFHRRVQLDMCIVGGEVSDSVSMKCDGHRCGTLYLCGKKQVSKKKISTKN